MPSAQPPATLAWKNGALVLLDQTLLPVAVKTVAIRTPEALWKAIRRLVVRGAPAIGCAAAYGVVLGVWRNGAKTPAALRDAAVKTADYLATSRPTAVNLFWALDRMKRVADAAATAEPSAKAFRERLLAEAHAIRGEDADTCRRIGEHGVKLVKYRPNRPRSQRNGPIGILTHCNAGSLATSEGGTALSVMYEAQRRGIGFQVFADETRPLLQGSRLTAWELSAAGVAVTVICDNMAAQVMREGRIDLVVVGADRIARNGDTANKIGTYGVAVLAKHHGIPFYVAAPKSTFDPECPTGEGIPIERRDPDEIRKGFGRLTAPAKVPAYNPAFDVTPAELIAGIVTEHGVWRPCKQ